MRYKKYMAILEAAIGITPLNKRELLPESRRHVNLWQQPGVRSTTLLSSPCEWDWHPSCPCCRRRSRKHRLPLADSLLHQMLSLVTKITLASPLRKRLHRVLKSNLSLLLALAQQNMCSRKRGRFRKIKNKNPNTLSTGMAPAEADS